MNSSKYHQNVSIGFIILFPQTTDDHKIHIINIGMLTTCNESCYHINCYKIIIVSDSLYLQLLFSVINLLSKEKCSKNFRR